MCGSTMSTWTSSPSGNGHRLGLDLLARALQGDREVVERQALGALEEEAPPGLLLERVQLARAVAGELAGHARVEPDEVGLGRVVAARP